MTVPLRVAVVGAGPAGSYVADALCFDRERAVRVDLFDRLPTPFGLLRYGVAPDHLKMKSLQKVLQRTIEDPRVRFFGNVRVGSDVTAGELRAGYHAVVYAHGAPEDRRLAGLQSARRSVTFVITDACVDVKDLSCVAECPVDCIYEGPRSLYIQPDECIDCGACEAVCPTTAIVSDIAVRTEQERAAMRRNAEVFVEIGSPLGAKRFGRLSADHPDVASMAQRESA